jgi:hypothetical protein
MKGNKRTKTAHTSNTKQGSGDFYGQGIRNNVGIMREDSLAPKISKKQIKTAPRKLA